MGHHSHSTDASSSSKKHRSRDDRDSHSSKRHRSSKRAASPEDEWVEKAPSSTAPAPTGPPVDTVGTFTVGAMTMRGEAAREDLPSFTDGYGEGGDGGAEFASVVPAGGVGDMFSEMGVERKRREPKEKLDPTVSPPSLQVDTRRC